MIWKREPPEQKFHRSVAQYLQAALIPPDFFSTIGHGGGGGLRGAILQGLGLMPGLPDIFIFSTVGVFGLELKAGKNSLDPDQIWCHEKMNAVGVSTATAWTLDEVNKILAGWMIPTRITNWSAGMANEPPTSVLRRRSR